MARSLTVQHEETVRTSSLLNGFLLFTAAWMLLTAMSWGGEVEIDAPVLGAEASLR